MDAIKKRLAEYLLKKVIIIPNGFSSFSQEGEDLIIDRYLQYKKKGVYVDIGAMHPVRFSNTYLLYQRGWHGINIDATPGSMDLFNSLRPRDVNIEKPISSSKKKMAFYIFKEPALNTFSQKIANQYVAAKQKLLKTTYLSADTLSNVISTHINKDQHVDLLNIDVEGLEIDILNSVDWRNFRPHLVAVEVLNSRTIIGAMKSKVYKFMIQNKYVLAAKTLNTLIFVDRTKNEPN